MSVKTKKRFKIFGKAIAIALFALLMFTNIKIATMDSNELAKGDISLFGIQVTLFEATDAYGGDYYCEVMTRCSDGGYVKCGGDYSCEREAGSSVTCDGTTTKC